MEHLLVADSSSRGILVLAHGAGAGMRHAFLERLAQALAARKVATFRYEFVYMEKGGGRPDFAQGGGVEPAEVDALRRKAGAVLRQMLESTGAA